MRSKIVRSLLVSACAAVCAAATAQADFTLTLLHNNDGESKLLPLMIDGQPYAGADRFVSVVERERAAAAASDGILTLSSGDNFLAGAEFTASLRSGTFYDAKLINNVGYNALALGNHDFDFGPTVLADFISQVDPAITYLSANLDFSAEPALQALVNAGRIKKSKIVEFGAEKIGIIGATTPLLPAISSPGAVGVNPVVPAVQSEIATLTGLGVNKIILISHLQNINEDLALIPSLSGIDIVIAGGGDELLAHGGNALIPGDTVQGAYPRTAVNADGASVPVITTAGDYKYLGNLTATFDSAGNLTSFAQTLTDGGAKRVSGNAGDADSVAPHADTLANIVTPVQQFVGDMAMNSVAASQVPLNGVRGGVAANGTITPGVRTQETNFGNLFTDALLWQAQQLAGQFGVASPVIALQNGGGIRNNNVLTPAASPVTPGILNELNTFQAAAFSNFVSVIEGVPVSRLEELLEHSIASIGGGQFGQWAGLRFTYDPRLPAQITDVAGNILTPGQRIIDVWLTTPGGEQQIIQDGMPVDPDLTVSMATIDFLVRQNGDAYPFTGLGFTTLGATYQQALFNYLGTGLGGQVLGGDYPVVALDNPLGVEPARRIDAVPEPAGLAMLGLAALPLLRRRKR